MNVVDINSFYFFVYIIKLICTWLSFNEKLHTERLFKTEVTAFLS